MSSRGGLAPGALAPFFAPSSVALVGASATPGKWGLFVLHNLMKDGYAGKVYAVGRPGVEVFGVPFAGSLAEIGAPVDLVLVMVPPAAVLGEVRAAIAAKARAIYVVTAGFGETGAGGEAVERELARLSAESGVPIMGPNGQGITNTHVDLCAQMSFTMPPRGGIALVTQSGNVGVALSNLSLLFGVGMSTIVSTGNAACIDAADVIDHLAGDKDTRVITVYVEGVRDGRRLVDAIAAAAARTPVVVMKVGSTQEGRRAATSHSGAIASDWKVFTDACAAAGAAVAGTFEELWDAACILSAFPLVKGRRVGILTLGGGMGVITADCVAASGLQLPPLPAPIMEELDRTLPARWSRGNPIDLVAAEGPTTVVDVLTRMAQSGAFDALVFSGFGENGMARTVIETGRLGRVSPMPEICEVLGMIEAALQRGVADVMARFGIPVVPVSEVAYMTGIVRDSVVAAHAREGIMTFPTPERAVRALRHLFDYSVWRKEARR